MEAVELYHLNKLIEKNGGIPVALKTDCVVYKEEKLTKFCIDEKERLIYQQKMLFVFVNVN